MNCPTPDRLLADLAGENGGTARLTADAHVGVCFLCRAAVDALVAPDESLISVVAGVAPATEGRCPGPEDLACWCVGDLLGSEELAYISKHLLACEWCAFTVAQLNPKLSKEALFPRRLVAQSHHEPPGVAVSAGARASVIAQVLGALALLLASAVVVLPWLHRQASVPKPLSSRQTRALVSGGPIDWPFQAFFEFRLKADSEIHQLTFPHHPGIHLSQDYEYSIHVSARRVGWILLFSKGLDETLSLLFPTGRFPTEIPYLEAGQTARFPAGLSWESIPEVSGRREFYAVYLDSVAAAEKLVAESQLPHASGLHANVLAEKLDEMVGAGGCSSVAHTCVLTLEYEVF